MVGVLAVGELGLVDGLGADHGWNHIVVFLAQELGLNESFLRTHLHELRVLCPFGWVGHLPK